MNVLYVTGTKIVYVIEIKNKMSHENVFSEMISLFTLNKSIFYNISLITPLQNLNKKLFNR